MVMKCPAHSRGSQICFASWSTCVYVCAGLAGGQTRAEWRPKRGWRVSADHSLLPDPTRLLIGPDSPPEGHNVWGRRVGRAVST